MASAARVRERLFFGLPVAVTFSLGTWQLQRLRAKRAAIASRAALLAAPPLTLADLAAAPDPSALSYRRVALSAAPRDAAEMLVGPRAPPAALPPPVRQWAGGAGFLVVAPLDDAPPALAPLLVRGWVPQRLADPAARTAAAVVPVDFRDAAGGGEEDGVGDAGVDGGDAGGDGGDEEKMMMTAVVRPSAEPRSRFTPENVPATGEWYTVDAPAMAAASGAPPGARPVVLELLAPETASGWPFVRPAGEHMQFATDPQTHVVYATTWFSLAAALAALARFRFRTAALRRRGGEALGAGDAGAGVR